MASAHIRGWLTVEEDPWLLALQKKFAAAQKCRDWVSMKGLAHEVILDAATGHGTEDLQEDAACLLARGYDRAREWLCSFQYYMKSAPSWIGNDFGDHERVDRVLEEVLLLPEVKADLFWSVQLILQRMRHLPSTGNSNLRWGSALDRLRQKIEFSVPIQSWDSEQTLVWVSSLRIRSVYLWVKRRALNGEMLVDMYTKKKTMGVTLDLHLERLLDRPVARVDLTEKRKVECVPKVLGASLESDLKTESKPETSNETKSESNESKSKVMDSKESKSEPKDVKDQEPAVVYPQLSTQSMQLASECLTPRRLSVPVGINSNEIKPSFPAKPTSTMAQGNPPQSNRETETKKMTNIETCRNVPFIIPKPETPEEAIKKTPAYAEVMAAMAVLKKQREAAKALDAPDY